MGGEGSHPAFFKTYFTPQSISLQMKTSSGVKTTNFLLALALYNVLCCKSAGRLISSMRLNDLCSLVEHLENGLYRNYMVSTFN